MPGHPCSANCSAPIFQFVGRPSCSFATLLSLFRLLAACFLLLSPRLLPGQSPVDWNPVGSGANNTVRTIAFGAGGEVFAGGSFSQIGGVTANYIAFWDGVNWNSLGGGVNDRVEDLEYDWRTGRLYAAGRFTVAGGVSANRVAYWDGVTWNPLGAGFDNSVLDLQLAPDGTLYAAGAFIQSGSTTVNHVAKWDGTTWLALGTGTDDAVYTMALDEFDRLVIGGKFTAAGSVAASYLARWDYSSWSQLGDGTNGAVYHVVRGTDDDLYVGGDFDLVGLSVPASRVARWTGSAWMPLGLGLDDMVLELCPDGFGHLFASGNFQTASGQSMNYLAKWDGKSWQAVDNGANGPVWEVQLSPGGNLFIGGNFSSVGAGTSANYIAQSALYAPDHWLQNGDAGRQTTCRTIFLDEGGAPSTATNYHGYTDFFDGAITYCPEDSVFQTIAADFPLFDVETNFDALYVYNGPSQQNSLIIGNGNDLGPLSAAGGWTGYYPPEDVSMRSTHPSGCLTFRFMSDYSVQGSGWAGKIYCAPRQNRWKDECSGIELQVIPQDSPVVLLESSTLYATPSRPDYNLPWGADCSLSWADDDVWFYFKATQNAYTILTECDETLAYEIYADCPFWPVPDSLLIGCSDQPAQSFDCFKPGRSYYIRCFTPVEGGVERFKIGVLAPGSTGISCGTAPKVTLPASLPLNRNLWLATNGGGCAPNNPLGCVTTPNHPTYFWFKTATPGVPKIRVSCSDPDAPLGIAVWNLQTGTPGYANDSQQCGTPLANCVDHNPVFCDNIFYGNTNVDLPGTPAGWVYLVAVFNYDNLNVQLSVEAQPSNTVNWDTSAIECVRFDVYDCAIAPFLYFPAYGITGTILINNLAPQTGYLVVSNDQGYAQSFQAPFPPVLNFSMPSMEASGGTGRLYVRFSARQTDDWEPSYTVPDCAADLQSGDWFNYYNPYIDLGSDPEAGTIQGSLQVSDQGGAQYVIPLVLPEGTGGIQPSLALAYNSSNGGSGIMGLGWTLEGMSMISRAANTYDVDGWNMGISQSGTDKLSLDGERLIQTNFGPAHPDYLAAGVTYKTRFDQFKKVEALGDTLNAPARFRVRTKTGLIMEYGGTANARVGTATATFFWLLNKVSDTYGNYYTIEYFNNGAEFYPVKIRYAGNTAAQTDPPYQVDFFYTGKSDTATTWQSGLLQRNTRLLQNIHVSTGGNTIRDYYLYYEGPADAYYQRSQLTSVYECGTDGKCLEPTRFEWTYPTANFLVSETNRIPKNRIRHLRDQLSQVDVNGDGLPDFVVTNTVQDSFKVFLNTGTGYGLFPAIFRSRLTTLLNGGNQFTLDTTTVVYWNDFNGDNATDLLVVDHVKGLNQFVLAEPYADRSGVNFYSNNESFAPKDSIKRKNGEDFLLDFPNLDGNGVPEIFAYLLSTGKNDFYVKVVDANGLAVYQKTLGGFLPASEVKNRPLRFLDLDGDGNEEILHAVKIGTILNWVYLKAIKLTSPFSHYFSQYDPYPGLTTEVVTSLGTDPNFQNVTQLYFPDLNGDRLPDVVKRTGNQLAARLNLGDLHFQVNPSHTFSLSDSAYPLFVDFNVDGRSDYIAYNFNNGANNWFLNKAYNSFELLEELENELNPALLPAGTVSFLPQPTALSSTSYGDWYWYQALANQAYLTANGGRPNFWFSNALEPSLRIHGITNGLGLRISIYYSTLNNKDVYSSQLSNLDLKPYCTTCYYYDVSGQHISYQVVEIDPFEYSGRMPVVQSYNVDNLYDYSSNGIRYYYQRALFDKSGAGFRGFERVISHDLGSDLVTFRNYALMTPGNMSQTSVSTFFRGKLEDLSSTYTVDTVVMESYPASYVYAFGPVSHEYKTYFPFTTQSYTYNFDLDGKLVSLLSQSQQADAFGNVVQSVVDYGDGHRDSMVCTYQNDASKWHLGRLTRSELHRRAPGVPSVVRKSAFEYDALTGVIKKEILEPDLPPEQRLEMRYEHDEFGNVTRQTKRFFNGNHFVERNDYRFYEGVTGKFLLANYNDLDHAIIYDYDPVLGLPIQEIDPNGVDTRFEYDGFGRMTRTELADGNWKNVEYRRCFPGAGCPDYAILQVKEEMANGHVETSYFDYLGREVLSAETGFGNRTVYTRHEYNARGQLFRSSQPYYAGESPRWNSFTFDPLGREVTQLQDDVVVSTTQYKGKKIIHSNALGQTRTQEFSLNGRLLRAYDPDGNALEYAYDAQGNNTRVGYPGGHALEMSYDLFNHLTSLTDPDLGAFQYGYNVAGELLTELDPQGHLTTFTYDTLGRPLTRVETEEWTQYRYDNAPYAQGQLIEKINHPAGSSDLIASYAYAYDALSRPVATTMVFAGDPQAYTLGVAYDHLGRDSAILYPGAYGNAASLRLSYDAQGFQTEVRSLAGNMLYWRLDSVDAHENITQYTLGNGIVTRRGYDPAFDFLTSIHSRNAQNVVVQDQSYAYNWIGNLTLRQDAVANYTENFTYDNLNRLLRAEISGQTPLDMEYDVLGNITYKSDLGHYYYGENGAGPHVLTRLEYNNGAATCLPSILATYTYNSYDKLSSAVYDADSLVLDYTMDRQRYRQRLFQGQTLTRTKYYILGVLEREVAASTTRDRYFVSTPAGVVATLEYPDNGPSSVRYLLQDHLGSVCGITDAGGQLLQLLGYDAWGRRRMPNGMPLDSLVASAFLFDRGFTGHEHLDWFELINMNGRVYDPTLGRFLSPDPFIQDLEDIQLFNRYSYVGNNPLSLTDPSGYFSFKKMYKSVTKRLGKIGKNIGQGVKEIAKGNIKSGVKKLGQAYIDVVRYAYGLKIANERGEKIFGKETWNTIVVTGAVVAVTIATGGAGGGPAVALWSGAAGGFTGSALSVVLAGGDASDALKAGLKGAAIGAASAGLSYGVGNLAAAGGYVGNAGVNSANLSGYLTKVAGHALTQGAISKAQGGSFESGALSGAFTAAASPLIGVIPGNNLAAKLGAGALVGGTASEIGGGKFSNGAASGVVVEMYNGIFSDLRAKAEAAAEKATAKFEEFKALVARQPINPLTKVGVVIAFGGAVIGTPVAVTVGIVGGVGIAGYGLYKTAFGPAGMGGFNNAINEIDR